MTPLSPDAIPRLKEGCRFTVQQFRGELSWVLEDPFTGKFFRLGEREARFLEQINGKQTIAQLLEPDPDPVALTAEQRQALLSLAARMELLEGLGGTPPAKKRRLWNPLFLRFPLGNPDALFRALAPLATPLLHPVGLTLVLLLIVAGFVAILQDLAGFTASLDAVFSTSNALALFLVFLLLKVIHETGHGIVCRRLGGHVPEIGLFFFFFAPLTYVDATSSWRFPSKWQRMLVSGAGMLAEWMVAAVAALVWANRETGFLHTLSANIVWLAAIVTLLFNANPLMRFDGYFLLTDWLEIPNLYQKATGAGARWLDRWCLGIVHPERGEWWLTLYGLACLVWRVVLLIGIALAAIYLLHGIGVLLALMTVGLLLVPLGRHFTRLIAGLRHGGLRFEWWRPLWIPAVLALGFIPWQSAPAPAGVVQYEALAPVRVACPGFLEEWFVTPGDVVEAGQPIARLENVEEKARLQELLSEARRARVEALAHATARRGDLQAREITRAKALEQQAEEVAAFVATLEIRAPKHGVIVGARLNDLEGEFLKTGREICAVGGAGAKEVLVAIPQRIVDRIRPHRGLKAAVWLPGRRDRLLSGRVMSADSRATDRVRQPALTALAGGPLDLRQSSGDQDPEEETRLVEPVLYCQVLLDEEPAALRQGEPARVRFDGMRAINTYAWLQERWEAFLEGASARAEALAW